MSNVINFPFDKIKTKKSKSQEEDEQMMELIDELAEEITADVIAFVIDEGFAFDNDEHVFDVSLFFEVTKSMLCSFDNKEHAIQKIAKEMYSHVNFKQEDHPQLEFDF